MIATSRVVARAFQIQTKLRVIEPFAYLNVVVFPLIVTTIGLYLLSSKGHPGHAAYAILGGGLIGFWSLMYLNASNDINGERWTGTLELLMGAPSPLASIVVGKMLSSMLLGVCSFLPVLALAFLGFHQLLPHVDALPFTVSMLVAVLTFFSVGMVLAPLNVMARWVFPLTNGTEILVFAFCGFMFPVSQLPGWVQVVSWLLPPSWAVRALYASVGEPYGQSYALWWTLAAALSGVYLAISLLFFRFVERTSRVSGQLALV